MEDFPFGRLHINEELTSKGNISQVKSPPRFNIGDEDDESHFALYEIIGLFVDDSYTTVITHPDGHKTVDITLKWDDQAGADTFEVWIGRTLDSNEN